MRDEANSEAEPWCVWTSGGYARRICLFVVFGVFGELMCAGVHVRVRKKQLGKKAGTKFLPKEEKQLLRCEP